eukprot:s2_g57.t1
MLNSINSNLKRPERSAFLRRQVRMALMPSKEIDDLQGRHISRTFSTCSAGMTWTHRIPQSGVLHARLSPFKRGSMVFPFVFSLDLLPLPFGELGKLSTKTTLAAALEAFARLRGMVNHDFFYRDKIDCPGPPEISATVREAIGTREASTFDISSAPYWWSKLAGLIGRFVGYLFHQRSFMQMIYVDDLHGAFVGVEKFLHVWIWVLAFELVGVPFGYHKFKSGFSSEFVGFHIRYDMSEVGITVKRGEWLLAWISKAKQCKYVVQSREFAEFLGRLGFVAELLIWLKPHLSPLFAWASVTAKGTVGRLPDTVTLTLEYIEAELKADTFMVSTKRLKASSGECFRTDAKCADGYVVLGGWELSSRKWFSIRLLPEDAPYFFKEDNSSQWASTSAELMASYVALHTFGWLAPGKERKSVELPLAAGTDNKANESLSNKRATTIWPLMAVNMQLSSALARARLSLGLKWRPREENVEADQLTNEDYSSFDARDRISVVWSELDLGIVSALVKTRSEFESARERQKEIAKSSPSVRKKKFDKSAW